MKDYTKNTTINQWLNWTTPKGIRVGCFVPWLPKKYIPFIYYKAIDSTE